MNTFLSKVKLDGAKDVIAAFLQVDSTEVAGQVLEVIASKLRLLLFAQLRWRSSMAFDSQGNRLHRERDHVGQGGSCATSA